MKTALIWLALCLVARVAKGEDGPASFITEIHGEWRLSKPAGLLRLGQRLFAGEEIVAPTPCNPGDKVVLAYMDNSSAKETLVCQGMQTSYEVRAVGKRDPFLVRFQKAFETFLKIDLVQVKFAAGRAARGPMDAVIAGGDLSGSLLTLGTGDYQYQIQTLGAAKALFEGMLSWDPPKVRTEQPIVLKPGLYQLRMRRPDGESTGDPATLLVTSAKEQPRYQAAYRAWLRSIAPQSTADDGSVRILRVALLVSLFNNPEMVKRHP